MVRTVSKASAGGSTNGKGWRRYRLGSHAGGTAKLLASK